MKRKLILFSITIFLQAASVHRMQGQPFQNDTLVINHVISAPVINGEGSEGCWDSTAWEPIGQLWIPWGEIMDSADFHGRYKVLWNGEQDLMYVLAEITDDIFVDGYVYRSDPAGNNYPDYDVLEVFIDENASKGRHVFDGTGQTGIDWGYNGENAFSYHIMAARPPDDETVTIIDVCDIAGTSWSDEWIPNYKTHLPGFALTRQGNYYCWEFSFRVYDEAYDPLSPSEDSRVQLTPGKTMGLSFAYCDNDEAGTTRDNFIGSVWVPELNNNSHWMDAGDFRTARLTGAALALSSESVSKHGDIASYNRAERQLELLPAFQGGRATVFSPTGNLVFTEDFTAGSRHAFSFKSLPDGIYILAVSGNGHPSVTKICVY